MFSEEDFDIISVNDLLEQKNNKVINIMETLEEEKEFEEEEKKIEDEEEDNEESCEILLECEKNFDTLSTTTEVSETSEKSTQTIREKIDEILDKTIKDFSDIGTMTDIIFDDDEILDEDDEDDEDDEYEDDEYNTGDISEYNFNKTIELVPVEGKEEPEIVINEEQKRFKRRSCFSRFFYKILNWWFILKFKLFSIFRN